MVLIVNKMFTLLFNMNCLRKIPRNQLLISGNFEEDLVLEFIQCHKSIVIPVPAFLIYRKRSLYVGHTKFC